MKLTKKQIDGFIYEGSNGSRDVRWDDELSGFGVRVYPSSKKAFVLSYRVHHRKHLLALGDYGVLTLDQARKKAVQELAKILGGIDPLKEKQSNTKEHTMKNLCSSYLMRYAKKHKKTWEEDERRINKHVLPQWGALSVKSITKNDIAYFHANIGESAPYEANRILRLLSKMFELSAQWGFVEEKHLNPTRHIKLFKEVKRDRWLTTTELPKLAKALDQEQNRIAAQAIWLYLLTGARKSELLQAKWEDIDWERKELRLHDTKAGRTHYIPLSMIACELLESIQKQQHNPFIFPGHIKEKPLVNISKPWKRVCEKAGIQNARLHDLRRTVGSWLAQAGNSLHLIGKILNHSTTSTTAVYARFAQDQGREALENYAQKLLAHAGKSDSELMHDK